VDALSHGHGFLNAYVEAWPWVKERQQGGKSPIGLCDTNRWPIRRHRAIEDDRRGVGRLQGPEIFLMGHERHITRSSLLNARDAGDDQRRVPFNTAPD
jgi:hypothetical protein